MSDFNTIPEFWREINQHEFANKMTQYDFTRTEYRQLVLMPNTPAVSAKLFFYWDDTGLAVVHEYIPDTEPCKYKHVGRFFAFGCAHSYDFTEWDSETMGTRYTGLNAHKCTKCGHIRVVDSSD